MLSRVYSNLFKLWMEKLKAASPEEGTETVWWVADIWTTPLYLILITGSEWQSQKLCPGLPTTITYILMCQEGCGEGSSQPKGPRIPAKTVCHHLTHITRSTSGLPGYVVCTSVIWVRRWLAEPVYLRNMDYSSLYFPSTDSTANSGHSVAIYSFISRISKMSTKKSNKLTEERSLVNQVH